MWIEQWFTHNKVHNDGVNDVYTCRHLEELKICVLTDDASCLVFCDRLAASEIRCFNLMYKYPVPWMCGVCVCDRKRDRERKVRKEWWFITKPKNIFGTCCVCVCVCAWELVAPIKLHLLQENTLSTLVTTDPSPAISSLDNFNQIC